MIFKGLTISTRLLLLSALTLSAMSYADLDDLPSDCKNFHFRDISGMPITSSDKTGYFFKISQPEDRRKSKGMGDVFFRLLQDTEVDYIHPASSILLTAPELSFHIVGEGQYCRINEFIRQSRLLAEAWPNTRFEASPGKHHFDVIDDLQDPRSGLGQALLG